MSVNGQAVDTILVNGRIYTVDPDRRWVEAVAITNGRITALGSNAVIRDLASPATDVIDLAGRLAMPGFIDVHNHILWAGKIELFEQQFPGTASLDDILTLVHRIARSKQPGEWIVGSQWGADMLSVLNKAEALARLDEASLGHPVLLSDETGHQRWVNSVVLELAGIRQDSPDPEQGAFGRDAKTGALTGIMIESAIGIVDELANANFTEEMAEAAVARAVRTNNSYGITAFQDAASTAPILTALTSLDRKGALSAWAVGSILLVKSGVILGESGDSLLARRDEYRTAHVHPNFTKVFLDGVPGARTAAFHDAYLEDAAHGAGFRGEPLVSYPDLVRYVDKSEKLGMGLKIHCAGDYAVTQMLDAVEAVRHFNGPTKVRHHIAHASYIRDEDIPRFAELGVVADLCPIVWFPTTFLEGHKEAMGKERAERFWPNVELLKAGTLMAGGSDWPVIPVPDPWTGIEGLVTRQNPSGAFPGQSLWAEQALDLPTAIEIYTINSARAMGLDGVIGSLEVGKSADIIVLDQNVFQVPADRIADTKVLTTYFEGKVVFQR
ncbi:amidohydrolase [Labrys neptuniae]